MSLVRIQFTLFSAFYSPLISTMTGGFLKDEGLDYEWSIAKPGVSALKALENGDAVVVQSALSQGFAALANGTPPTARHFAQVNSMDGFFITGRQPDPDFTMAKLEGASVLVHHGTQPMAMFRYACHRAGIDAAKIDMIDAGSAAAMDEAFRAGTAAYIHQQGPAPQQLEADGAGYVVGQLGPLIGDCGFSSLAALPAWLESPEAAAFMRAYRKTRDYINDAPAAEIAAAEAALFPSTELSVLTDCIATYQQLGTWSRHVEITPEAYAATQDIFAYNNLLAERYPYEAICCQPPSSGSTL